MSEPYPCVLELARPERFERAHVPLRLLAFLALAVMGVPLSALFIALYVLLPVLAALAYAMLLTDQVPRLRSQTVHFSVAMRGEPTISSALARILYGLPELL